jgi:hypothetical protein
MMLRASSQANDLDVRLEAVNGADTTASGVPHGDVLVDFVEAAVEADPTRLSEARAALTDALGHAGMVDTAAVVANFEMMTRIADATGTSHPAARLEGMGELRHELGLDGYASARSITGRNA